MSRRLSIRSGKVPSDLAEVLIIEINVPISIGQMFDSPQGPVLFLAHIRKQGTLRGSEHYISDRDVRNL